MSVTVKEDQQLQMLEKYQGQIHTLAEIISVNHGFHQFISEFLLFQFCIQHDAIQELTSSSLLLNISMSFIPESSTPQLSRKCFSYEKELALILHFIPFPLCRSGKLESICSLQARVQVFLSSGENRADNTSVPVCLPDLKPQPSNMLPPASPTRENKEGVRDGQNKKHRAIKREGWKSTLETHGFSSKDGQREYDQIVARYTDKEEEMNVAIPYSTPLSSLSDTHAPDDQLRMVHTLPNFVQAMAEARKARYIRHRGQPLCDRELSIREIFASNSRDTHSTH